MRRSSSLDLQKKTSEDHFIFKKKLKFNDQEDDSLFDLKRPSLGE